MCALPKKYKKDVDILPHKIGVERLNELYDNVRDNGTFLPKGVMHEDLDSAFIDFVEKDLSLVIDGEKVPVIFLTLQRWVEFTRTWQFTDNHKDIKIPFITIVRNTDIQPGTNQQSLWNTAARLTYRYVQVPTFDGVRKGVDIYKIPQPTSVDLTYEVRLFTNKMRDLNNIQTKIHQVFRSRQFYITPNEHPMPVVLDSISDENTIDDFENRRFYVQVFEMRLQGYILDSNEFEVIPAKSRALLMFETETKLKPPAIKIKSDKDTNLVIYNFVFRPYGSKTFSTKLNYNMKFISMTGVSSLLGLDIKINGNPVTIPFTTKMGDVLSLDINKSAVVETRFTLNGNLL